jgi:hypothetical protein
VTSHPARDNDVQQRAQALLIELEASLPPRELEAALARGAMLELDQVVGEILAET